MTLGMATTTDDTVESTDMVSTDMSTTMGSTDRGSTGLSVGAIVG